MIVVLDANMPRIIGLPVQTIHLNDIRLNNERDNIVVKRLLSLYSTKFKHIILITRDSKFAFDSGLTSMKPRPINFHLIILSVQIFRKELKNTGFNIEMSEARKETLQEIVLYLWPYIIQQNNLN
jgi:hypothetical protein